jgi:hypothetical protein
VKGVEQAIALAEVHGIGGSHKLSLLHSHDALTPLKSPIPVRCSIVEAGRVAEEAINGTLTKLSSKRAELHLDKTVPALTDLKTQIVGDAAQEVPEPAYCKVEGAGPGSDRLLSVRFTSLPRGFEAWLRDPEERVAPGAPPAQPGAPHPTSGDRPEATSSLH